MDANALKFVHRTFVEVINQFAVTPMAFYTAL